MAAMIFPAHSILRIDGNYISDHSRDPLAVDFDQIESAKRTVNGDLRAYEIAKKHKLSTSWKYLPSQSSETVDGYYGGIDLYGLYMQGGALRVEVWFDAQAVKTQKYATLDFMGRFSSFNWTVEKRNLGRLSYDFWNVDLELEEI